MLCSCQLIQKKQQDLEDKQENANEHDDVKSDLSEAKVRELEFTSVHGITRTEEHTDSVTPLQRRTSDIDEISLLFEDAMEYQDDDINEILAELAATHDSDDGREDTLTRADSRTTSEWEYRVDDRRVGGTPKLNEREIMIDCPPYVPSPMTRVGPVMLPPPYEEIVFRMRPIREDVVIPPPGSATIGHSPTYQRSAFEAFGLHRPHSLDRDRAAVPDSRLQVDLTVFVAATDLSCLSLLHGAVTTAAAAAHSP